MAVMQPQHSSSSIGRRRRRGLCCCWRQRNTTTAPSSISSLVLVIAGVAAVVVAVVGLVAAVDYMTLIFHHSPPTHLENSLLRTAPPSVLSSLASAHQQKLEVATNGAGGDERRRGKGDGNDASPEEEEGAVDVLGAPAANKRKADLRGGGLVSENDKDDGGDAILSAACQSVDGSMMGVGGVGVVPVLVVPVMDDVDSVVRMIDSIPRGTVGGSGGRGKQRHVHLCVIEIFFNGFSSRGSSQRRGVVSARIAAAVHRQRTGVVSGGSHNDVEVKPGIIAEFPEVVLAEVKRNGSSSPTTTAVVIGFRGISGLFIHYAEENMGFAGAVNRGIVHACGRNSGGPPTTAADMWCSWFFVVNADVVFVGDVDHSTRRVDGHMDGQDGENDQLDHHGGAGGGQRRSASKNEEDNGGLVGFARAVANQLSIPKGRGSTSSGLFYPTAKGRLDHAAFGIARAALCGCGLLDEGGFWPAYMEDIDWRWRIHLGAAAGAALPSSFSPSPRGRHRGTTSTASGGEAAVGDFFFLSAKSRPSAAAAGAAVGGGIGAGAIYLHHGGDEKQHPNKKKNPKDGDAAAAGAESNSGGRLRRDRVDLVLRRQLQRVRYGWDYGHAKWGGYGTPDIERAFPVGFQTPFNIRRINVSTKAKAPSASAKPSATLFVELPPKDVAASGTRTTTTGEVRTAISALPRWARRRVLGLWRADPNHRRCIVNGPTPPPPNRVGGGGGTEAECPYNLSLVVRQHLQHDTQSHQRHQRRRRNNNDDDFGAPVEAVPAPINDADVGGGGSTTTTTAGSSAMYDGALDFMCGFDNDGD